MGVFKDIANLLKGMKITSKHLGRHAITVQYPEERDKIPERSRGIVVLLSDKETGELNCTACMLCARACPTAAIQIVAPRDEKKKRHLQSFQVDNSLCCFCGLCEEVCNFVAIKMATKYEFATYDKGDLVWDMKKLQEMGRDVPYTPKPKKKPVAKATPKAKEAPAAGDAAAPPKKAAEDKPAEPQAKPEADASEPSEPTESKATNPPNEETSGPDGSKPQEGKGEV
jgi:NADH-quinone oxidoreductase subunit I